MLLQGNLSSSEIMEVSKRGVEICVKYFIEVEDT
jgi:hypothetical protein